MIELVCDKNRAFFRETEKLTSGSIGVTINFVFSPEWDGLLKTAVFDAGETKIDVVLTSESCEIPPEVLACPGKQLSVGVFGELADKTLVIPTIYAEAGIIRPGASPSGMSSAPPTPSWPEQVQAIALEAKEVADSIRSDADAGKFNGPAGEAGGWYTPEVKQPIKGAMVVNFTPSKEGMPAAPGKNIILPQGETGETGGYYTPAVTQPDENTLRVAFTPSKEDMPAVADTDITLPAGGGGGGSGSGADGKSAYAYAVEGGYTGTEEEFAAKLAQEKFANPNALTFTGAVTGSYDGSEAVTVEIPSGEGENAWTYEKITLEEAVNAWTIPIPSAKRLIIIPFLRANDTDNSLNTGSVNATFKVNNAYAGYPGVYLRNSARYYSLYDIEKVKAHTKVLYTGAFDNGIAYSVSKGLVVNGWLQTTADATEEITSVQFSLSTGYLFPADCTVEVWYK